MAELKAVIRTMDLKPSIRLVLTLTLVLNARLVTCQETETVPTTAAPTEADTTIPQSDDLDTTVAPLDQLGQLEDDPPTVTLSNPCKGNPCGSGICTLDYENSTSDYHCYCEDGFTGPHCETDWDECWSDPCLNGGTCVDKVADFNCTCAPGFRGKQCEINVDECISDPCQHNGTCVDDVNGYFCECHAGFSGINCEVDISVCNTSLNKCSNGGECVDGLGEAFECTCPPGWRGPTCEDNVDECASESPCLNGGMCMDTPGSYLCSCQFGFTGDRCQLELEKCDSNPCQNDALCFVPVEDSEQTHHCYCVPDYHGPHCEFKYNDCFLPPFPKCFNGGRCRDGVDSFTCECEGGYTGDFCECPPPDSDGECLNVTAEVSHTLPPNFDDILLATTIDPSADQILETTTELEPSEPLIEGSMAVPTGGRGDMSHADGMTASTIVYNMTEADGINPVTSLYIYEFSSSELVTKSFLADEGFIIQTSPTLAPDYETVDATKTLEDDTLSIEPDYPTQSFEIPVTIVTEAGPVAPSTPVPEETTTEVSNDEPVTSGETDLEEEEEENEKDVDVIEVDTKLFGSESCQSNVCRNGGTCISTLTGPKCHCPLQFTGRQCEEELDVETPGFLGHSLLVHQLDNDTSGFDLMLSFRTSTPDGLIFYTGHKDQIMIAGYVESGTLKFKVSCGTQVILFTDPRNRVDTGYTQSLKVELAVDPDALKCSTVIHVNETHTMRGQQEIEVVPAQPATINFGLMPPNVDPQIPMTHAGFQGCMKQLQIFGQDVHLYKDAVSGRDIVECSRAVCAIRPCRNGAICTQNQESGSWFCNCPPGFTGTLCERPVCETNPCRFGGTCLGSKSGPGFLCLCPVGRSGSLCQDEVEITQPMFTPSVGGYSSYLAYPINANDMVKSLEAQFHFSTDLVDQVALLFFIGQNGLHELEADYIAVSYVKGHILLTWDLGAGPRRIFTRRPVDSRYLVHSVQFGRWGKQGWLQVDNFPNITGRAPGLRENLNVTAKSMFLGGHLNHNFSLLPHDLPVHRGFDGCIFDLAVRSALGQLLPVSLPRTDGPIQGRNVHQCHMDICASSPCSNGGTCIGFGASFICECPDGKYGVTCDEVSSACTTGRHKCAEGSKCTVVRDGSYICRCPLGKIGQFCDKDILISDPLFRGEKHSAMQLTAMDTAIRFGTEITIDIKPEDGFPDGIILHFGQSRDARHQDFFTLMMKNNSYVLTFSLGGPRGTGGVAGNALTLTLCCARPKEWQRVEAGRFGREGFLRVDGKTATGTAPPGLSTLDVDNVVHLGGLLPDYGYDAVDSYEVVDPHFTGCLSGLRINGRPHPLTAEAGWKGWSIDDCDGTACGAEVCANNGTCQADSIEDYTCTCEGGWAGRNCLSHSLCAANGGCLNGAECDVGEGEVECHCPLGFTGDKCQQGADVRVPRFNGDGFIRVPIAETDSIRHVTSVAFEMKTNATDGLVFWIGEDLSSDDYLGLGLRDGMIHLVWNLGWFSRTEMTVPAPSPFQANDGAWHQIKLNRARQSADLELDGEVYNSRVTGSYYELNTHQTVLFGGSEHPSSMLDLTRGHFNQSYTGCLRNIVVQNTPALDTDLLKSGVVGRSVGSCLEQPQTSSPT